MNQQQLSPSGPLLGSRVEELTAKGFLPVEDELPPSAQYYQRIFHHPTRPVTLQLSLRPGEDRVQVVHFIFPGPTIDREEMGEMIELAVGPVPAGVERVWGDAMPVSEREREAGVTGNYFFADIDQAAPPRFPSFPGIDQRPTENYYYRDYYMIFKMVRRREGGESPTAEIGFGDDMTRRMREKDPERYEMELAAMNEKLKALELMDKKLKFGSGKSETKLCSICGRPYEGYGHNPQPVVADYAARCCEACNSSVVLPAREARQAQGRTAR